MPNILMVTIKNSIKVTLSQILEHNVKFLISYDVVGNNWFYGPEMITQEVTYSLNMNQSKSTDYQ